MAKTTYPFIESLNPPQRKAVEATEGRVLVLAGAGSGKTKVLTVRIAYLISHKDVAPKHILGLTFTNKAAREMRERLAALVSSAQAKQVTLATFHSFCMQVLRNEAEHIGYQKNFTLYDEQDIQRLATSIAKDITGCERELPSITTILQDIARARCRHIQAEQLPDTTWHENFTRQLYRRLIDALRTYNAMDFDSLLSLTVQLFENHPSILERYQDRYRYLMIDEYQDTNPVQYQLAKLLSSKFHNLCVVGDDDQAIYGWRGADVSNILDFQNATTIRLEQNYRSTNTILSAANAVIKNNSSRHEKTLWSAGGDGQPIDVFHAPTEQDEAKAVINRLLRLKDAHALQWKDCAVLYRSNALSRQIELALMKQHYYNGQHWVQGIPYQVHGGAAFYERREVRDVLAYLRCIVNPSDQEALLRIINLPRRGIGDTTLATLKTQNHCLWSTLRTPPQGLPQKALTGIQDFVFTIEEATLKFATESLAETLQWLLDRIDFPRAIAEDVKSEKMRRFKWENVQELVNALAEYEMSDDNPTLEQFVQDNALNTDYTRQSQQSNDRIHLLTFHSAKGLEFPACFLIGLEDHIIPHEKSMKETGEEEERRLMYVALTRAKRFLTLSMAQQRLRTGKLQNSKPSRFLFEIPKSLLTPSRWDSYTETD